MNFVKKLVAAFTATTFIVASGLSSVYAVKDNRDYNSVVKDLTDASLLYSLTM